jgi:hypothetical protein
MKEQYQNVKFKQDTLDLITIMNKVIEEYIAQGFVLTVRQLYYQLVARGVIENTERSYKRTTGTVNDARLAGVMDWDAIEDRTRAFDRRSSWTSGGAILAAVADQFHMDMWAPQDVRPFVIVEKEALAGVLQPICHELDIPLLAARGYPSVSVLRDFAKHTLGPLRGNQDFLLLHLGDHDPSGLDMTRDLVERLRLLTYGAKVNLVRLALNMDQVREQSPPPNPAKVTDSRFEEYQRQYGDESWELDALQPAYLSDLVRAAVDEVQDKKLWLRRMREIEDIKSRLQETADNFDNE